MGAKVNGSFKSLRFPDYLGTDEAPAYIRFEPIEIDFGKFKNSAVSGGNFFPGTEDNPKNKVYDKLVGNKLTKLKQDFKEQASSFIEGKLNIGGLTLDLSKDKDLFNTQGSINLYLPNGIGSKLGLDYDGGASGVGVGKSAAGALDDVMNGSVKDVAGLAGEVASATLAGMISKIANTNTARVITGLGAGVVSNNVTFQLFKGVKYRTFPYAFDLVAKNSKESAEIKKICDTLLWYSLPSRDKVEVSEGKGEKGMFHFYDIPAMWKIDYMYKDASIQYHQKPNTYCILSDIDVQYPSNMLYSDGAPLQVQLSLTFTEVEPMYRAGDEIQKSGEEQLDNIVKDINVKGGAKQIGPTIPGVNGGF